MATLTPEAKEAIDREVRLRLENTQQSLLRWAKWFGLSSAAVIIAVLSFLVVDVPNAARDKASELAEGEVKKLRTALQSDLDELENRIAEAKTTIAGFVDDNISISNDKISEVLFSAGQATQQLTSLDTNIAKMQQTLDRLSPEKLNMVSEIVTILAEPNSRARTIIKETNYVAKELTTLRKIIESNSTTIASVQSNVHALSDLSSNFNELQCTVADMSAREHYSKIEARFVGRWIAEFKRSDQIFKDIQRFINDFEPLLRPCGADRAVAVIYFSSLYNGFDRYFTGEFELALKHFERLDRGTSLTQRLLAAVKQRLASLLPIHERKPLLVSAENHIREAYRLSEQELATDAKRTLARELSCQIQSVDGTYPMTLEAIECWGSLVKEIGAKPSYYYQISALWSRIGQFEKSIGMFEQYLAIVKGRPSASDVRNDPDFRDTILTSNRYRERFASLLGRMAP